MGGGEGAVFTNSLKVDFFKQNESVYFSNHKKSFYNCYFAIYACFMSVPSCKSISDQHFLQSFNKIQLKIERELYTRHEGSPVTIRIHTRAKEVVQGHGTTDNYDKNGAIWCIVSVPKCVIIHLKINSFKYNK